MRCESPVATVPVRRLVSERQAFMAAEAERLTEEALGVKGGPGASSGGGGGGGGGNDCGVPYLRLRVVGVTPLGVASGGRGAAWWG